ncbi:RHS repeat domain-containing protein [Adhaeretor mobilis]|uniref:RHS repeat-associated core domain-containing protein n=1 Tax=Adhaeretor mobilis TaxID=1930276 RepID=A0A517N0R2_9BACT|nr:hypothetical protein HG15A2_39570 [Adhaeretor mobilis]
MKSVSKRFPTATPPNNCPSRKVKARKGSRNLIDDQQRTLGSVFKHISRHETRRAFPNEYLYTGRRLDPGTGLQINRHRFYASHLGRWVNRDPIGYLGSEWNLYEYASSAIAIYRDPYGLEPRTCEQLNIHNAWENKKCRKRCFLAPHDTGYLSGRRGVYWLCRDKGRPSEECHELARKDIRECKAGCDEHFPQQDCNPAYCDPEDTIKEVIRDCGALGLNAFRLGLQCTAELSVGSPKAVFTCAKYATAQEKYMICAGNVAGNGR